MTVINEVLTKEIGVRSHVEDASQSANAISHGMVIIRKHLMDKKLSDELLQQISEMAEEVNHLLDRADDEISQIIGWDGSLYK